MLRLGLATAGARALGRLRAGDSLAGCARPPEPGGERLLENRETCARSARDPARNAADEPLSGDSVPEFPTPGRRVPRDVRRRRFRCRPSKRAERRRHVPFRLQNGQSLQAGHALQATAGVPEPERRATANWLRLTPPPPAAVAPKTDLIPELHAGHRSESAPRSPVSICGGQAGLGSCPAAVSGVGGSPLPQRERVGVGEPRHLVEDDEQVALKGAAGGNRVRDRYPEPSLGRDRAAPPARPRTGPSPAANVDRIEGRGGGVGRLKRKMRRTGQGRLRKRSDAPELRKRFVPEPGCRPGA